ncbi:MAG: hypothetical protein RSD41_03425 [Kiritimatiellia bacterium]
MAEPRKITIKLRPVGARPVATAATSVPTAAEVMPAAAPESVSAPMAATEVATDEVPVENVAQQAKRQTSRIELSPEMMPISRGGNETVKLRPVSASAEPVPSDSQAAKSKTARIALDTVLGGIQTNAPFENTTQKTIKLKRSTPTAPKPTTSAPMSPVPDAVAPSEEKTIKLRRPTLSLKKDAGKASDEEATLEPLDSLPDDGLEPLDESFSLSQPQAPQSKVMTIIGIVAAAASILVLLALGFVLQKQAASPDGSDATGNTLHSLPFNHF